MKPVASGAERTAQGLRNADAPGAGGAASNVAADYAHINPYCFEPPISPHIAAKEAGIEVDTSKIRRGYDAPGGAGGLGGGGGRRGLVRARSASASTMADLAWCAVRCRR